MNRWNIPDWLEQEVRARDDHCIYCRAEFAIASALRRSRPSWEHIVNDARIVTRENIALCCIGVSGWARHLDVAAAAYVRSAVASGAAAVPRCGCSGGSEAASAHP